ncbi:LHFPL tetraspan subfamily member 2 protein [Sipha flava]|uniref:LHFPL tetraspan subfamily member 2 protein n=1 Tax=Sipha flava TaxID=143950 RepID=A0A2S2QY71_9HEMI|nr:LHFPL tetraspan subfamily member 2 protein [Sipha flava]XP_025424995.1 LHFPL tetraspan subfamily member 2 protein [Sipha flava]
MYFILTAKSLLWVTLSVLSTITMFMAIYSPKWLVGSVDYKCNSPNKLVLQDTNNNTDPQFTATCRPSEGVYYRCTRINGNQHCGSFAVEGLSTDSSMFPTAWKIAVVLMSAGVFVSFLMSVMAVSSFCKQAIRKKSMFGVAGSGQGLAGLLYLIGVICFAAGWGSERIVRLCGAQSEPFVSADCTTGSGLYTAAFGVFLTFATAMLSGPADRATSSDKVALQLEQGENVVFLL